jgi:hypothetical protein
MSQHHKVHFPTTTNSRRAVSSTSLSNKLYKIKPMIILHFTICTMYTIIFPDQENDFLSLKTVSMLNLPENVHFDLLKVISKRVELMADKFSNYVPNTFVKSLAIIGLVIVYSMHHIRSRRAGTFFISLFFSIRQKKVFSPTKKKVFRKCVTDIPRTIQEQSANKKEHSKNVPRTIRERL